MQLFAGPSRTALPPGLVLCALVQGLAIWLEKFYAFQTSEQDSGVGPLPILADQQFDMSPNHTDLV